MEDMENLRSLAKNEKSELLNIFEKKEENQQPKNEKQTVTNETDKLVEEVFTQAVTHRVKNDTELQDKMLDTAKKFTETKMEVIKNKVDKEDKEAFFDSNQSACECFGYEEKTTEKWAVSMMKKWHNIMTAIWLGIGFFTYAPIAFIAKKISVIFKKTWIAVIIALILYLGITLSPLWISLINGL
jgi:alpha-galactosidase/6-phospho-beta-glucosidase family protein